MKRQIIAIGLLLGFLLGAPAWADIYRWKDANGVTHFSNEPPPPGMSVIERIEETPYDVEADRQRTEEERQLRLERQKLELEERKADLAAREREAQTRLDEAERRMNEARQIQQRSPESEKDDDCDEDYYLRYGTCGHYPAYGGRYFHGRPGNPNLYRGYYRENNNLYYKDPHRYGHPPGSQNPPRPGTKPAPKTDSVQSAKKGKKPLATVEEPTVKSPPASPAPAASK
jgi:hypothetical protein